MEGTAYGVRSQAHLDAKNNPIDGLDGKESACSAEDLGLIPGSGRSPGEWNGNPLQYSCLKNLMYKGAWRATVPGGYSPRVGHD